MPGSVERKGIKVMVSNERLEAGVEAGSPAGPPTTCACGAERIGIQDSRSAYKCGEVYENYGRGSSDPLWRPVGGCSQVETSRLPPIATVVPYETIRQRHVEELKKNYEESLPGLPSPPPSHLSERDKIIEEYLTKLHELLNDLKCAGKCKKCLP